MSAALEWTAHLKSWKRLLDIVREGQFKMTNTLYFILHQYFFRRKYLHSTQNYHEDEFIDYKNWVFE